MASVHPFRAERPPQDKVKQVSSPPYDVMNTDEARQMAHGNDLSFLHVSRPEIDLPANTDIHADEVYNKAGENYCKLITAAPLTQDDEPNYYIYRLMMPMPDGSTHTQTGIAAAASVDDYDKDIIRKHEKTRPDKEDDRTRHLLSCRAQTGPVFLTYRQDRRVDSLVEAVMQDEPLYDFTSDDKVRHTVWKLSDTEGIKRAFDAIPLLYIADGHHRAASASRSRAQLRDGNKNHQGDEDYNRFLTVIFPDNQMQILPYNRAVKDLGGRSAEEFMRLIKEHFTVSEGEPQPRANELCSMYLAGKWYGLTPHNEAVADEKDVAASLDVSRLQEELLSPLLGIHDIRTDKRIDFIGGIRGTKELETLVNSGKAAVAFSMRPTRVSDLLKVSDANQIMPPKSTWFEPKLRDGILIHKI